MNTVQRVIVSVILTAALTIIALALLDEIGWRRSWDGFYVTWIIWIPYLLVLGIILFFIWRDKNV